MAVLCQTYSRTSKCREYQSFGEKQLELLDYFSNLCLESSILS